MPEGTTPSPADSTSKDPGRIACVHVDLDSLWVLGRFRRFAGDVEPDPLLHGSVQHFLDLFDEHEVRATFFLTGRDAASRNNQSVIRAILEKGNEIANHSMTHPPNFNSLSREELRAEIEESTLAIEEATGRAPAGFRAPTFNISGTILDLLEERGYAYDSSVLPAPVSPFYAVHRILAGKPSCSYGRLAHCRAPLHPYHPGRNNPWERGDRSIYEVPVSTMPILRLPFHASYALLTGKWLFTAGLSAFSRTRNPLIYLLHSKDLFHIETGPAGSPRVRVFPSAPKKAVVSSMLGEIKTRYRTMTTVELIEQIRLGEEAALS